MAFLAKNQTHPYVLDVTGYAPYAVARLHRAVMCKTGDEKSRRRDAAIRDYWNRRNFLEDVENYVIKHNKDLFRSQWECSADKKGLYSRVKWEMDKIFEKRRGDLEGRRNRLAEILQVEEDNYLKEVQEQQLSPEGKKAQLLTRYKNLRIKKEKERQEFAKEKIEQQWRKNCEELRPLISKKIHDQIYTEGMEQMKMKTKCMKESEKEDAMYAELWKKDSEAKLEKEVKEKQFKRERNLKFCENLKSQIRNNEEELGKEIKLKEEEAKLLAEQKRLMEIDSEWELAEKRKKQERMKKDLDRCLKNKKKIKAKEAQEDLMLDLYFLKQIQSTEVEDKELEKKHTLWKEQQQYLMYLKEQIKKETEFGQKMEKYYQDDSEKMWEKREKQWEAEKRRREELREKTIKDLCEQIEHQLAANRQQQKLIAEYGQEVKMQAEQDQAEELEEQRKLREKNCTHQRELLDQIKLRQEMAAKKMAERNREMTAFREAEANYEERVKKALDNPKVDILHPYRTRKLDVASEKI